MTVSTAINLAASIRVGVYLLILSLIGSATPKTISQELPLFETAQVDKQPATSPTDTDAYNVNVNFIDVKTAGSMRFLMVFHRHQDDELLDVFRMEDSEFLNEGFSAQDTAKPNFQRIFRLRKRKGELFGARQTEVVRLMPFGKSISIQEWSAAVNKMFTDHPDAFQITEMELGAPAPAAELETVQTRSSLLAVPDTQLSNEKNKRTGSDETDLNSSQPRAVIDGQKIFEVKALKSVDIGGDMKASISAVMIQPLPGHPKEIQILKAALPPLDDLDPYGRVVMTFTKISAEATQQLTKILPQFEEDDLEFAGQSSGDYLIPGRPTDKQP